MNLRDMSGLWLVSEIIANEVMAKGRTAWHVRCEEMCLTLLAVGEKKKKKKTELDCVPDTGERP